MSCTTTRPTTWPAADFHPTFSPGASARIANMEPGAGWGALRQVGGCWQVYIAVMPTASNPSNWAWVPWDATHQPQADRFARYGPGWEDPAVTWEAVNNVYTWLADLQGRTPSEVEYNDYGYRPDKFDALRLSYLAKHPVPVPVVPQPDVQPLPTLPAQPTVPALDFAGLFAQLQDAVKTVQSVVQQVKVDAAVVAAARATIKPNELLPPKNPKKRR